MAVQPIVKGIESVGSVELLYRYNSADYKLPLPKASITLSPDGVVKQTEIDTLATGIAVAGFRLDREFLRANQLISSSVVIPILGGGGLALTNNIRAGTLTLATTRVSTPSTKAESVGQMVSDTAIQTGIFAADEETASAVAYDIVLLAQCQQAAAGGDSNGAQLTLKFDFNGKTTSLVFEACTVASVLPVGLAGNDAVDYQTVFNYLNWTVLYQYDA